MIRLAQFKYKAKTFDNKTVRGVETADDLRDLQSVLKSQSLTLIRGRKLKESSTNPFFSLSRGIKKQDVVTFIRQLSVMVSAGISVDDAIDTLRAQVTTTAFKKVLTGVYEDLLKGNYLSDSFAKYPKIFPSFFKNMVYVGEVSGNLPYVLNKVADYYERDMRVKAKAKGAMTYPMFLLALILVVFVFLTVYIVPQFDEMFSELGGELPILTKIIVLISGFMQANYLKIIAAIVGTIIVLWVFFKTKPGRYVKDYLKLKIPLIKKINYSLITSRFARGLGVLISSGMLVIDAIETIGKLMDNVYFEKKFAYAVDEVKRGKRIARSVDNIKFFPKMLIEMILVGESTGSLDVVLEKTADYYDDLLEKTITQATASLEPILIIFAGGVVAVVILAIFLPMMSIMDLIK